MNLKITDLIYRKNNFIKKEVCNYFINIFEKHINLSEKERSLKYIENKKHEIEEDNYKSLDLNFNANNEEIKTALGIRKKHRTRRKKHFKKKSLTKRKAKLRKTVKH